ncbi:MAG: deoxyhypusine synthase family protein [Candidatus Peregrinibacteria bacterium]|nr:deoxyhypusine synthase family protein [Candidatus Peregrinibacteria bacterium]
MKKTLFTLIETNMIDCIVSTGANMVDMDFFEALGFRHYIGDPRADDEVLRQLNIDRIYDTFISEHEIFILDAYLKKALDSRKWNPGREGLSMPYWLRFTWKNWAPLQLYPATDLRAPGWSFIQPITTSHFSGHYFEKPGKHPHIRMDFYSCASINWRKIVRVCDEHLHMGMWKATFIDRQIDERDRAAMHFSGDGDLILEEIDLLDHSKHLVDVRKIANKAKREVIGIRV